MIILRCILLFVRLIEVEIVVCRDCRVIELDNRMERIFSYFFVEVSISGWFLLKLIFVLVFCIKSCINEDCDVGLFLREFLWSDMVSNLLIGFFFNLVGSKRLVILWMIEIDFIEVSELIVVEMVSFDGFLYSMVLSIGIEWF